MENNNNNPGANNITVRQDGTGIQGSKLSLQTLLFILRRKFLWIIAFGILGALLFAMYTTFFIAPKYSSTAKFFVNNKIETSKTMINAADMSTSVTVAQTCIVIVKNSVDILQEIADASGVEGLSGSKVGSMMSAEPISETEAFRVTITATDPEVAYRVAQAFHDTMPGLVTGTGNIIEGASIRTIDNPTKNTTPISPNRSNNALIGGFIGIALSFAFFFLREILDNTIYGEEDVKELFSYPVIGIIPTILGDTPDSSKGSAKKKKKLAKAYGSYYENATKEEKA